MAEDRVLLTRRANHPAHGKWTFPGGYVEWGEPVETAAIRETYEETGLAVDLRSLVGVYSYEATPVVIVVYEARVTGGTITLCHENDRVEWIERGQIPWEELAFPPTTAALRDFLAGRTPRGENTRQTVSSHWSGEGGSSKRGASGCGCADRTAATSYSLRPAGTGHLRRSR